MYPPSLARGTLASSSASMAARPRVSARSSIPRMHDQGLPVALPKLPRIHAGRDLQRIDPGEPALQPERDKLADVSVTVEEDLPDPERPRRVADAPVAREHEAAEMGGRDEGTPTVCHVLPERDRAYGCFTREARQDRDQKLRRGLHHVVDHPRLVVEGEKPGLRQPVRPSASRCHLRRVEAQGPDSQSGGQSMGSKRMKERKRSWALMGLRRGRPCRTRRRS